MKVPCTTFTNAAADVGSRYDAIARIINEISPWLRNLNYYDKDTAIRIVGGRLHGLHDVMV